MFQSPEPDICRCWVWAGRGTRTPGGPPSSPRRTASRPSPPAPRGPGKYQFSVSSWNSSTFPAIYSLSLNPNYNERHAQEDNQTIAQTRMTAELEFAAGFLHPSPCSLWCSLYLSLCVSASKYDLEICNIAPIHVTQFFNTIPCHLSTIEFSLFMKVVQEYERAVIFRLGRLPAGGSKGPGKWDQSWETLPQNLLLNNKNDVRFTVLTFSTQITENWL